MTKELFFHRSVQQEENHLLLIGTTGMEFGGSLYIKELFNETSGKISDIDYTKSLDFGSL